MHILRALQPIPAKVNRRKRGMDQLAKGLRTRLLRTGKSQTEIGAAVGLAQSTVGP
jgi:hypothetical protein